MKLDDCKTVDDVFSVAVEMVRGSFTYAELSAVLKRTAAISRDEAAAVLERDYSARANVHYFARVLRSIK